MNTKHPALCSEIKLPALATCIEAPQQIADLPLPAKGKTWEPSTIAFMFLANFGVRLLETIFFVGLAGAAVVVLISFFADFKELFGEE